MMMGLSVARKQMTWSGWRGLDSSYANLLNTSHLGTLKPKVIEVHSLNASQSLIAS